MLLLLPRGQLRIEQQQTEERLPERLSPLLVGGTVVFR